MKTLNNLTPAESRDLYITFGLDFNTRVLTNRLHQIINCNAIPFKDKISSAIERWMCEIDDISSNYLNDENKIEDPTNEDA